MTAQMLAMKQIAVLVILRNQIVVGKIKAGMLNGLEKLDLQVIRTVRKLTIPYKISLVLISMLIVIIMNQIYLEF
jgi:hypothetical protein